MEPLAQIGEAEGNFPRGGTSQGKYVKGWGEKKGHFKGWACSPLVEHLPSTPKALGSIPSNIGAQKEKKRHFRQNSIDM